VRGGALVVFDLPGMAERAMYFGDEPMFSGRPRVCWCDRAVDVVVPR
jgi:hypothetical protein